MDGPRVADEEHDVGDSPSENWASAQASTVEDEEDFYIPERRLSLDLGDRTMDTNQWHDVERAHSPVPSYTSMESEGLHQSDELDEKTKTSVTRVQLERTDSYSSCDSVDSDDCESRTRRVRSTAPKAEGPNPVLPVRPELIRNPDEKRHPALTVEFTFKAVRKTLEKLDGGDLRHFKVTLWKRYPESFNTPPHCMDMVDLVDRLLECYDLEVALQLTKFLLKDMGLNRLVNYLQDLCKRNEVRYELRENLKRTYSSIYEGLAKEGEQKTFDSMFTELYITDGGNAGPNIQHEVKQIAKLSTNRKKEKLITCREILKPEVLHDRYVRCVVTNVMAGMGKSVAVQKFILDWAWEREHQHVYFLFPLPFRELNRMDDTKLSLLQIVHTLYPETKRLSSFDCDDDDTVMFVCDGLDEFKYTLDFHQTERWCDSTEACSLRVLVTNLLRGNLSRQSLLWVTSRPLTSSRLPPESVHQVLEVRGFTDAQKEEYFRKKFEDPAQADRVIAHLTSCKTLYIMCHVPIFCWVVSGLFQRTFQEQGPEAELPKELTQIYSQFLLVHLRVRGCRVAARSPEEEQDFLMKLGKMAFIMLEKGQTVIPKATWKDCGVEIAEAVTNSSLCIEFFIEQFILYQERIQCFIHPTIQEYLAALYVFLSFRNLGKNILEQPLRGKLSRIFKVPSLLDLHRCAVERSLQSQDGSMDLFLRFLLGMAQDANQELLQRFMINQERCPSVTQETASFIRKKIKENHHPDRNANLQRCLDELGCGAPSRSNSLTATDTKVLL